MDHCPNCSNYKRKIWVFHYEGKCPKSKPSFIISLLTDFSANLTMLDNLKYIKRTEKIISPSSKELRKLDFFKGALEDD